MQKLYICVCNLIYLNALWLTTPQFRRRQRTVPNPSRHADGRIATRRNLGSTFHGGELWSLLALAATGRLDERAGGLIPTAILDLILSCELAADLLTPFHFPLTGYLNFPTHIAVVRVSICSHGTSLLASSASSPFL